MSITGIAGGRITVGAGANLLGIHAEDKNPDATCYVGNIDVQADEDLIWELFMQVGPVSKSRPFRREERIGESSPRSFPPRLRLFVSTGDLSMVPFILAM